VKQENKLQNIQADIINSLGLQTEVATPPIVIQGLTTV